MITNELLIFEKDSVVFQEKGKQRDSLVIRSSPNQGRDVFSATAKEQYGNSIRAKIRLAATGSVSPSNQAATHDTKSVKSQIRSLSIVSKPTYDYVSVRASTAIDKKSE